MKNSKFIIQNEKYKIQNAKPHKLIEGKELRTEYKMNRKTIINGKILKNHKETR
jgi:hypothetical protein